MKILNHAIPQRLQENGFIKSLKSSADKYSKLSIRQSDALEDILEINLDFHHFEVLDVKETDESNDYDYRELLKKYSKNNFRTTKTRNRCVRALNSLVDSKPRYDLINEILYPTFQRY